MNILESYKSLISSHEIFNMQIEMSNIHVLSIGKSNHCLNQIILFGLKLRSIKIIQFSFPACNAKSINSHCLYCEAKIVGTRRFIDFGTYISRHDSINICSLIDSISRTSNKFILRHDMYINLLYVSIYYSGIFSSFNFVYDFFHLCVEKTMT
jgi:hypothetical protein